MAVVQPEARSIDRQRIEQLAYSLWQRRGCPDGSSDEDWFRAERELQAESPDQPIALYAFGVERATETTPRTSSNGAGSRPRRLRAEMPAPKESAP